MGSNDAFVCLMVCFPLIETIIRHELSISEGQELTFSDNSPAVREFAKFMTIPEPASREIWDAARNGLLHRAMIKGTLAYDMTGRSKAGRPAEHHAGHTTIYVWDLRDKVVSELEKRHRKLWRGTAGSELPNIYVRI
jgi:hypothetical protein